MHILSEQFRSRISSAEHRLHFASSFSFGPHFISYFMGISVVQQLASAVYFYKALKHIEHCPHYLFSIRYSTAYITAACFIGLEESLQVRKCVTMNLSTRF